MLKNFLPSGLRGLIFLYLAILVVVCAFESSDEERQCDPQDLECHMRKFQEERDYYEKVMREEGSWTDDIFIADDSEWMRVDVSRSLSTNIVRCWPSVGGIVVAEHAHAVELEYIGADRFRPEPRSNNATEEDKFCMKLRKIGGKWWKHYADFEDATIHKRRMMYPDERDVLILGWPEDGGVWVMREHIWKNVGVKFGPVWNALNMRERCKAIEIVGGTFYAKAEDCEFVKPLLEGFGNRLPRNWPTIEDGGWWDHGYELPLV
jgi:hypothetical protein